MDGDTERALAALIIKEAAALRRRAEEEGIGAYLRPKVRYRPNSNFFRGTVRSMEQVNRIHDVNKMWRLRALETGEDFSNSNTNMDPSADASSHGMRKCKECGKVLDSVLGEKLNNTDGNSQHSASQGYTPLYLSTESKRNICTDEENTSSRGGSLQTKNIHENLCMECISAYPSTSHLDSAVQDPSVNSMENIEIEKFLESRVKRGRGMVGARMDFVGPHQPSESILSIGESVDGSKTKWERDKFDEMEHGSASQVKPSHLSHKSETVDAAGKGSGIGDKVDKDRARTHKSVKRKKDSDRDSGFSKERKKSKKKQSKKHKSHKYESSSESDDQPERPNKRKSSRNKRKKKKEGKVK